MSFVVAIPSYERYDIIEKATLSTLERCGIPSEIIYIFVSDREQKKRYKEELGDKYKIIIGKLGLENQRNFITKYFKEGQRILNCDDDLYSIQEKHEGSPRNLRTLNNLTDFIDKAFDITIDAGAKLFGVYPCDNSRFMGDGETTVHLCYIVGAFWGCINDRSLIIERPNKEDFERTIKSYIKNKAVVRFNNVCIKTKYYKEKGGLQANGRTLELNNEAVELLCDEYDTLCRPLQKKDKEMMEIKLIGKKKIYHPATTKEKLIRALEKFNFSKNRDRPNITGVDEEQSSKYKDRKVGYPVLSNTLGYFRLRGTKKTEPKVLTKITEKNLPLYELLKEYAKELNPDFNFTTICLNKNVVCKKHRDKYNSNESMIIGLGDYTGGNLYIEGVKHNIKDNPIYFNGSKQEHWNDEITSGTKYSLIFFTL